MDNKQLIYYIIGGLIIIILIYIYVSVHNKYFANKRENFVALSGIEGPLTTYDGYGTFNFIFNLNDLPYYDPVYWDASCLYPDIDPMFQPKNEKCGSINFNKKGQIIWDSEREGPVEIQNSSIKAEDDITNINEEVYILTRPTRRQVVPSNYTSYTDLLNADHLEEQLLVKKDRPQASRQPPQPSNYYFPGHHPKAEPRNT